MSHLLSGSTLHRGTIHRLGRHALNQQVYRQNCDVLEEANRRLQEAAEEDETERIIRDCKEIERILGAAVVQSSPHRAESLIAHWRRERSGQLPLFDE
jgi:hypothetical protein